VHVRRKRRSPIFAPIPDRVAETRASRPGIKRPKRRLTSRKETAGIDDKNDLDAVCYPTVGGVRLHHNAGGYVMDVLGVLGMVRYAANGDEVVTRTCESESL
jgi:hypothetical protein